MKMFESIKDQIKDIKKIVFVTGAGISQESGIPTFRGKDGLWRNHDAMKLATINAESVITHHGAKNKLLNWNEALKIMKTTPTEIIKKEI